jgi:Gram-negative bacterial TonB protein C-terminal
MSLPLRVPSPESRVPARAAAVCFATLLLFGSAARAQTRGAEIVRQQKATMPDTLLKGNAQGNVILIARIDKKGAVQDAHALWATHPDLVQPTLAAVQAWSFRPALADGQPIEIAANIVFPFRIKDEKGKVAGRELLGPAISDLALFPADASGKRSAPEGFPLRKGSDPRVRVEATLDLPAVDKARTLPYKVEAISPARKRTTVYEGTVSVARKQTSVPLRFHVPVSADWEDGVWLLRVSVDGADAGGGQFWLARDPAHFDFANALRRLSP